MNFFCSINQNNNFTSDHYYNSVLQTSKDPIETNILEKINPAMSQLSMLEESATFKKKDHKTNISFLTNPENLDIIDNHQLEIFNNDITKVIFSSSNRKRRYKWTSKEKTKLLNLFEIFKNENNHWEKIANLIPGKTSKHCYEKWKQLNKSNLKNTKLKKASVKNHKNSLTFLINPENLNEQSGYELNARGTNLVKNQSSKDKLQFHYSPYMKGINFFRCRNQY